MADALGVPVTPSAEPEGSSRGAVLLASEALGLIPSLEAVPADTRPVIPADPARHARYRAGSGPAPAALRPAGAAHDRGEESGVMTDRDLDQLGVNTIRFLAADAVQQAKSGHPGLPMGAAAMAYVLWTRFLRHHPADPAWPDRDRFVLSAGHGSMLLYALLHLTGYDLPLEEIKRFRQWGSKTPGHPEFGRHPGGGGDDRPPRPGIRQRRRHGHRRAPPRRPVQPAGPHRRRPPHLRPLLGRRPHGGRRRGGGVAGGAPRARQADRPLRRQPGVARGEGGAVVLGGRAPAVRGARVGHADRPRRQRPRRDRQGHPGRAGGDRHARLSSPCGR